ncbi:MAG: adenosylmethionine decarboxylase [Armatimonas sp.]
MIGNHLLLDGFGCAPERMTDAEGGGVALTEAALAANMTPLSIPIVHIFPGGGYTALLPLAESHLSIHTYPERGLFCADLFTCGPDADPDAAVAVLKAALAPIELRITRVDRGETK